MEVKIIRSAKRKKTVAAHVEDGVLVVRAPADIPQEELMLIVAKLMARVQKAQPRKTGPADAELARRAQELNQRYFDGKLAWDAIRWVSNQKKRLGSCTPATRQIRISARVAELPAFVRDYVIVHELAHLAVGDHSAKFWALVNRYPKAERARGYLMALGSEPIEDE